MGLFSKKKGKAGISEEEIKKMEEEIKEIAEDPIDLDELVPLPPKEKPKAKNTIAEKKPVVEVKEVIIEEPKLTTQDKLVIYQDNVNIRTLTREYKAKYRRLAEIERQIIYGMQELDSRNNKKKYVDILNEKDEVLDRLGDIKEFLVIVHNLFAEEDFKELEKQAITDWFNLKTYKAITSQDKTQFAGLI